MIENKKSFLILILATVAIFMLIGLIMLFMAYLKY